MTRMFGLSEADMAATFAERTAPATTDLIRQLNDFISFCIRQEGAVGT